MKARILITLVISCLLMSCSSTKENNLAYFKNLGMTDSGTLPKSTNAYPIRIQPDDELVISVNSAVPQATAAYNLPMDNPATRGSYALSTQPRVQTYVVNQEGDIMMPQLGKLHVAGMTTGELAAHVTKLVEANVKDPYVRVEISNFQVDVMGEVRSPMRLVANKQYYTVLDALAQCGDLTEYGKRDRVFVIRTGDNGERTYQRLDLTDTSVFSSPYFYLRQNDVVYVEPNEIRIDNSKYNTYNAFKLSMTSTIVSAVSVIASLIIALTSR